MGCQRQALDRRTSFNTGGEGSCKEGECCEGERDSVEAGK
jgi:hypothetical protein